MLQNLPLREITSLILTDGILVIIQQDMSMTRMSKLEQNALSSREENLENGKAQFVVAVNGVD